ncbi:MAG: hypothetical protein HC888_06410 [Candidatus Competibacteraceae bacterium]|nr:hypothetical protein [Candidatus Competibacteraceae bacterium]
MTVDLKPGERVYKIESNDGPWVIESVRYCGGEGHRAEGRWIEIGVMNMGMGTKTFVAIVYIE